MLNSGSTSHNGIITIKLLITPILPKVLLKAFLLPQCQPRCEMMNKVLYGVLRPVYEYLQTLSQVLGHSNLSYKNTLQFWVLPVTA